MGESTLDDQPIGSPELSKKERKKLKKEKKRKAAEEIESEEVDETKSAKKAKKKEKKLKKEMKKSKKRPRTDSNHSEEEGPPAPKPMILSEDDGDDFQVVKESDQSVVSKSADSGDVDVAALAREAQRIDNNEPADISISCKDCKEEFMFTIKEQAFFKSRNLRNRPQRCAKCKVKKAARDRKNDNRKSRKNICFAYVKGKCDRGLRCRFKHGNETPAESSGANSIAIGGKLAAGVNSLAELPKGVCFDHFRQGGCARGDDCKFAHSLPDTFQPNTVVEKNTKMDAKDIPKGVCFDFFSATCSRGDDCKFPHVLPDGFVPPQRSQSVPSTAEIPKGVCFDFRKGGCDRGDSCKFAHTMA